MVQVSRLAERDEWKCWLCGNGVDPLAPVGSLHAASIDHVVPRAAGGQTTDDNLRLAHRRCNTQRGSRIPELTWPDYQSLIDSAQLWPAVQRLVRKPGVVERVAVLADEEEAFAASSWVASAATTITGTGWTSDVEVVSNMYRIRLSANS